MIRKNAALPKITSILDFGGNVDNTSFFMGAKKSGLSKLRSTIIKELHRILYPNGFIVIYEHDCHSKDMWLFIDIEHALYDTVISKKGQMDRFYAYILCRLLK
jgi:hypothetical protein